MKLRRFPLLVGFTTVVLLAGCAGRPMQVPLQVSSTTNILTSGQSLTKGQKVPTSQFRLQDDIIFFVYVKWDDPSKQQGLHTVSFNWYKEGNLVSTATKPMRFNTTPTELWTRRTASALGVGHYKVEVSVEGKTVGLSELDIIQ